MLLPLVLNASVTFNARQMKIKSITALVRIRWMVRGVKYLVWGLVVITDI